jgi:uncharacterized membrane-anchored protein YitT (DUF2179 family)
MDFIRNLEDKDTIVSGVSFVLGTFLLALCYNLFFLPNNLVVGGMSGIGIVLEKLTGFSAQLFIYISSILLLIVSYIFIGKENTKRVAIGSIMYPVFITFTSPVANSLLKILTFEEILVVVVLASILYGVSNGIIYKYGFSTGGTDVLVKVICKYFHTSEGNSLRIINMFIILSGGFVFGVNRATYSIIILVISSIIVDKISIGISDAKKFMIYTREPKKVKKIISDQFQAGFTIFPTVGGYSHIRGDMIMCVIRNRDVTLFKQTILRIDPKAFFVISDCYEVQGGLKRSNLPFM